MKPLVHLALAFGILLTAGCSRLADPRQPLPEELRLAMELLPAITGDEDVRDKTTRQVALRLAEMGWLGTASDLLTSQKTFHGTVGLAEISVAMARQQKIGLAGRYYRIAEKAARQFLPNLPRPIPIAMAQAAASCEKWDEADRWMEPMAETFDRAETQSKVYAERLRAGRASPEEIPPMWEPEVLEARSDWILAHRSDAERVRMELVRSMEVVSKMFPVDQPEAYLAIFRVARELGDSELQEAAAAGAIRSSTSLARDMEDTAILQAKVAEGLFAARDPRALLMMRSAREASDEPPGFYQPVALGAVAEVMQKMGQTEAARETYTEAWKRAFAHVHPRARVVNAVEILLSQSRAGVKPSAEDLDVALAIQRGERGKPLPSREPSQEVMEEVATNLQKLEAGKTNPPAKLQE